MLCIVCPLDCSNKRLASIESQHHRLRQYHGATHCSRCGDVVPRIVSALKIRAALLIAFSFLQLLSELKEAFLGPHRSAMPRRHSSWRGLCRSETCEALSKFKCSSQRCSDVTSFRLHKRAVSGFSPLMSQLDPFFVTKRDRLASRRSA